MFGCADGVCPCCDAEDEDDDEEEDEDDEDELPEDDGELPDEEVFPEEAEPIAGAAGLMPVPHPSRQTVSTRRTEYFICSLRYQGVLATR